MLKTGLDPKTAITQALHEVYCLPAARGRDQWTRGHQEVDRNRAGKMYARLVREGVLPAPPAAARRMIGLSDDFLAAS